ncbi:MAG: hypothetical protein HQ530_00005 [Parcubacteria group bacterium]|nr:hypothetical protein [Parcubacteria group bacterium]
MFKSSILVSAIIIAGGAFLIATGVSAASTDSLQPASTITYNENLVVNGSGQFSSLRVGSQGTGGVTYFNGSIVNSTTGDGGADNPVTFGDSVRIDGAITRGASGQNMPVRIGGNLRTDGQLWGGTHRGNTTDGQSLVIADTVRPAMDAINDFGSGGFQWRNGFFSGTLSTNILSISDLQGTEVIESINIEDGTITGDDIAGGTITGDHIAENAIVTSNIGNEAVTTDKISNEAVTTDRIGAAAVTPAKISGSGGANIPIAYGYVNAAGDLVGGTSNVSTSLDIPNSRYQITIDGVVYEPGQQVVVITPAAVTNSDVLAFTAQAGQSIEVTLYTTGTGSYSTGDAFHFVVYQVY